MNPNKKIINLKGKEIPKSGVTQDELDELPKKTIERVIFNENEEPKTVKVDIPDRNKLEKETVGNIIINCLAGYKCQDRKEGFYINLIAQSIIGGGKKVELKEKLKKFLIEILDDSVIREEEEEYEDNKGKTKTKKVQKGIYFGWAISQCLEELGIKETI